MRETDQGVKWFNTTFYPQNRRFRASRYEDGVLPRLRQSEVTLFTPWGPRYDHETRGTKIQVGDKELQALELLSKLLGSFKEHMPDKSFRWVFLGADLYGSRINNLLPEVVTEYFDSMADCLSNHLPSAEWHLWSEFDNEAVPYREEASNRIYELLSPEIIDRAERTAKGMGRGSDPMGYLVERLAEAMLVEARYSPIKISLANKTKDVEVDLELPCLYFVPSELLAPWM